VGVITEPSENGHVLNELFSPPKQSSKNDGTSTVGIDGAEPFTQVPAVGPLGQVPSESLYRVLAVCAAP
jgi:hypothetical protein